MAVPEDTGYPMKWFKNQHHVRDLYECVICLEVIKDPVQVRNCGHQFCRYCLDGILRLQPHCPSCREDISNEVVFSDKAAGRAIGKLEVNCPYDGCAWEGNLTSFLQDHTKVCLFFNLNCSNEGCNLQVMRKDFENHLTECQHRIVICEYCNYSLAFKERFEHFESCQKFPMECRNKCSQKNIPRNEMELHLVTDCPNTVVECKYLEFGCKYECERHEMEEHLRHGMKEHLELSSLEISRLKDKHKKDIQMLKREIAGKHEKEMQELKHEITDEHEMNIRELKQDIAINYEKDIQEMKSNHEKNIRELKQDITSNYEKNIQEMKSNHEREIQELKREITGKHEKDIQKLRRDITSKHDKDIHKLRREITGKHEKDIQELTGKINQTGAVIKITEFNRKLSDAKDNNSHGAIESEPFFTSPVGYKIKMLALLNDTREEYKDHMGVYIKLMKSDHDAILSWPFKKKYIFTLIDQQDIEKERKNVVSTLVPGDQNEFKRPESEMNTGIGCSGFVCHTTLKTRKYIKDDTVFITLHVES